MSMERVAALILTKPLEQYSSNTREVLMNSVSSAVFEIMVSLPVPDLKHFCSWDSRNGPGVGLSFGCLYSGAYCWVDVRPFHTSHTSYMLLFLQSALTRVQDWIGGVLSFGCALHVFFFLCLSRRVDAVLHLNGLMITMSSLGVFFFFGLLILYVWSCVISMNNALEKC